MKKILFLLMLIPFVSCSPKSEEVSAFQGEFMETFSSSESEYFHQLGKKEFRYYGNIPSLTEEGTDIMLLRLNLSDPEGPSYGPELYSKKYTHFGTYSARIRVADVKDVQPNIGAVTGYFTYRLDEVVGLSEIDFEWLVADPEIIYIGTWTTSAEMKLQRVGRAINLAEGLVYETNYFTEGAPEADLTGEGNQPETVPALEGYDASKRFYVYGFDWYPDRLTWWIINPDNEKKIILWDYKGSTPTFSGIPQAPTVYMMNFFANSHWPVITNPDSVEKPAYPYSVEVDWMSYKPFEEISSKWVKDNNWK